MPLKVGVRKVSTYNGFYNITTSNNIFTYTSGAVHTVIVAPGIYTVSTIQAAIRAAMTNNGETAANIANFKINIYTPNVGTNITSPFAFDFTPTNSINTVLGFNATTYALIGTLSFYLSQNPANITSNDYSYVQCSIITSGYTVPNYNGNTTQAIPSNIIYGFPIMASPGSSVQFNEVVPMYLPTRSNIISTIQFTLVNKYLQQINNPGQAITIDLEFI